MRTAIPVIAIIAILGLEQLTQNLLSSATVPAEIEANFNTSFDVIYWLLGAWLANRLISVTIWNGLVENMLGRKPPRLIVQLFGVLVFLMALSGIVYFVFGQSVTAIWATSGAIGIVIGLALRNLILDTFSGLAIHLERPFSVGDWITCHTRMGDYIGRVEETNWRTTRLWTTSRNMVIIPNSYLTTTLITNFSMPDKGALEFGLEFVLDFSVPTERAIRVLSAAMIESVGNKGPMDDPAPEVRVSGTTEYGIQYKARYFLEPADVSPSKARHTIISNVAKHVQQAGLTLSYPRRDVFVARMPWRQKNWNYHKDQIHHLSGISLFESLEQTDLEFIADNMSVFNLGRGDVVVEQGHAGDSMFILAEGLMDVLVTQNEGDEPVKVANLAPGTFFGEKSLLTGAERSATITCVTDSVVCEITKDCIADLLSRKPELAEVLARSVAERDMQNQKTLTRASRQEMDDHVSSVVDSIVSKIKVFFNS